MYGQLPEIETTDGKKVPGYPVEILNPAKTAVLRLPTTQELLTYLAAQKVIYRGNLAGEREPTPKADLALFNAIRIDKGGVEFDSDEADYVIGRITLHQVTSCEREGQNFRLKVLTPFGTTEHVMSIPFHKDMNEYRRNSATTEFKGKDRIVRSSANASVKLYDKTMVEVTGYFPVTDDHDKTLASVPPHHKRAVVADLVSAIDDLDPGLDPNS